MCALLSLLETDYIRWRVNSIRRGIFLRNLECESLKNYRSCEKSEGTYVSLTEVMESLGKW